MASQVTATCTCLPATARAPGAIGLIQLHGEVTPVLERLTSVGDWPVSRLRLVRFGDIDEGLAGRVSERAAHLMPHGGPRVMQRLVARLEELGVPRADPEDVAPRERYPEARDDVEALVLATLARARSPLATDLLLDQPRRWREAPAPGADDEARSRRLNRLVDPPCVVLAGPPNVGKSTLSNALFGRALSITLDRPGTTRDYTRGWLDLGGLVVEWHDTPGLRDGADEIEQQAVALALSLMESADLLVAITDTGHDWPELPREPDLRVASRCDLGARDDADVRVCAPEGEGIADLVRRMRDTLVPPADLEHPGPWRFDRRLPRA
ncbi:MAG: GTPase [Planctomycetota bacterium]